MNGERPAPTRREFVVAATLGIAGCSVLEQGDDGGTGTPRGTTETPRDTGTPQTVTESTPSPTETPEDYPADPGNFVFVTDGDLERQRRRVEEERQPWTWAYESLIDDADGALEATLESVVDDDGEHAFSKANNEYDYKAAIRMSRAARDCGLAYQFTEEDRYAERAVEILHHWILDDSAYMAPTVDVADNVMTIRQHITVPAFVYAAALVRGHPAWDQYDGSKPWTDGSEPDAEAAFRAWLEERYRTFPSTRVGTERPQWCQVDNKWAWRITDRAATAAYLQNDEYMQKAREMWQAKAETTCEDGRERPRPWADFSNSDDRHAYDGSGDPARNAYFEEELGRTTAFSYTAYNLKAMTLALVIFERYDGSDLWDFNAPTDEHDGSSLWKVYNWFEEYVRDTSAWEWDEWSISKSEVREATSTYELAYAHWGDFKDVLDNPDKLDGRWYSENRVLGPVTLTHGAQ